jgi:hypothetical protein
MKPQMNTNEHGYFLDFFSKFNNRKIFYLSVCICVHLWLIFLFACSSAPTDLRSFAPNETLIYLETKDLSITLETLTQNETFKNLAQNSKDFSVVKNVQVAVAVTGFETSEKQLTGENSALNFKPRFVAVADTHLWSWQTRAFAEEILGNFVNETYGGEVNLEVTGKDGGDWYEWTAQDGRKVFAFVEGSLVFFSNDQAAIEKSLAVKKGEGESLMKNENLRRAYDSNAENKLAFGYVSPEGIAQIANIAGVSAAIEASESNDGRNFISRVLPQILRNTTKEIVWTATKNEQGIEDKFAVSLDSKFSTVFKETLAPSSQNQTNLPEFLPSDIFSATKYNLKNPLIAWRSLLLVTKETTDAVSGNFLQQFSGSLLSSYGISDAEMFLSSIDSESFTAQFDAEGEKSVTIVSVKDAENIKKSLSEIIDFKTSAEKTENAEIWHSKDKQISAAFAGNILILGNAESVLKCLQAKLSGQNFTNNPTFGKFSETKATATTFGKNLDSAEKIVGILGNLKEGNKGSATTFLTQTEFTERGIERKTVSDFGFIGTILEQLEE